MPQCTHVRSASSVPGGQCRKRGRHRHIPPTKRPGLRLRRDRTPASGSHQRPALRAPRAPTVERLACSATGPRSITTLPSSATNARSRSIAATVPARPPSSLAPIADPSHAARRHRRGDEDAAPSHARDRVRAPAARAGSSASPASSVPVSASVRRTGARSRPHGSSHAPHRGRRSATRRAGRAPPGSHAAAIETRQRRRGRRHAARRQRAGVEPLEPARLQRRVHDPRHDACGGLRAGRSRQPRAPRLPGADAAAASARR